MSELTVVTGRMTEVHRFINVPMHWTEQYPARERREMWITQVDGHECKLVVHSRVMPARSGHAVCVLSSGMRVLALCNLTTGDQVSFVDVDPPLLLARRDVLRLMASGAVFGIAACWTDAALTVLVVPLIVALIAGSVLVRWLGRLHLQNMAKSWFGSRTRNPSRMAIRRVK